MNHGETLAEVLEQGPIGSSTPPQPLDDFSSDLPSSPDSYAVEMLEREISSLLEHDQHGPPAKQAFSDDPMPRNDLTNTGFEGNLEVDLVAVLQAAHAAQTRDVHSKGTEEHLVDGVIRETTRNAPTFHSLMAGARYDSGLPQMLTYGSDNDDEDEYGPPTVRLSSPVSEAQAEFRDLSDILNHLSDLDANPELSNHFPSDFDPNETLPLSFVGAAPAPLQSKSQPVASTSQNATTTSKKNKSDKSLTCELCSKKFTRRSDLTRHNRIHTGERPWVCTHGCCNKTFIQRSALMVHLRTHTGEKPHSCEYPGCGRLFGDSSSLARHRRTHTGKRPYKCEDPECDKTFTRRSTLNVHMRSHDPTWESDIQVKFKPKKKKQKIDQEEYDDLEGSLRLLTALFSANETGKRHPFEEYVTARDDEEDDEEEDQLANDSDRQELPPIATLAPESPLATTDKPPSNVSVEITDDLFAVPLRARKGKDRVSAAAKRKR